MLFLKLRSSVICSTCQWRFKLSTSIFISLKVRAILSRYSTGPSLSLSISYCPSFCSSPLHVLLPTSALKHKLLFSHPPLWPVILLFEAWALFSECCSKSCVAVRDRAERVLYSIQRVQATWWTDEIPWSRHCAWFVLFQPSCQVEKFLSLEIEWSHMVVSNFHPRFWFDITKSPIMMRWYTDSDTCLADNLSVSDSARHQGLYEGCAKATITK